MRWSVNLAGSRFGLFWYHFLIFIQTKERIGTSFLTGGAENPFWELVWSLGTYEVYHSYGNPYWYETWVPHPLGFQGCGFCFYAQAAGAPPRTRGSPLHHL